MPTLYVTDIFTSAIAGIGRCAIRPCGSALAAATSKKPGSTGLSIALKPADSPDCRGVQQGKDTRNLTAFEVERA